MTEISDQVSAIIEKFEAIDVPDEIEVDSLSLDTEVLGNVQQEEAAFFKRVEAAFELSHLALQCVDFSVSDDIVPSDKTFGRSARFVTELHLHDIQTVAAVIQEFRADGSYRARFARYVLNREALTLAREFQTLQSAIG